MTWIVPAAPEELRIPLVRSWSGAPLDDECLHGFLAVSAGREGLRVRGGLPDPTPGPSPLAPPGTRVANLWKTDVVELFWVGPEGRYVEIELGAYGHFLVLSFHGPRDLANRHEGLCPAVDNHRDDHGWETTLHLPWTFVPRPLEALGAFALARGAFIAAAPLPGSAPDFHQPAEFPRARMLAR